MSLRYQGKPYVGSNRIVDKIDPLCFCKFVAVGYAMDDKQCTLHDHRLYYCGRCSCINYRPAKEKRFPAHWPICVCGHISQEHN